MQKRIDLYIEGQKVDMFKDESLNITEVIKDVKDPSKIFTSFSKRFTLPASKINNKVFKHYHRNYIDNSIDARAFLNSEIKLNGVTYQTGNLELMSVSMSDNNPDSYKVVFYGNTTELAKQLKNDELVDLDLRQYDHSDAASDIYNTFRNAGDSTVIKYPLISKEDRFIWDPSDATYAVGTDNMKNIAYVDSTRRVGDYGVTAEDLAPAMKIEAILDAIEAKYNFTWHNDSATKQDYIKDLHLLLYKKQIETNEAEVNVQQRFDSFSTPSIGIHRELEIYINGNLVFGNTGFQHTYNHELNVSVSSSNTDQYNFKVYRDGVLWQQSGMTSGNYTNSWSGVFVTGSTYHFEIEGTVGTSFSLTADTEEMENYNTQNNTTHTWTDTLTLSSTANLIKITDVIPNMKIVDFLSSIFKLFNLVATIDKDNVVLVRSWEKFQSDYTVRDITRYIDQTGFDIAKTNVFNRINFEFKEPKLQLTKAFSQFTGRNYGSQEYAPTVSNNRITGSEYNITLPLQMPVSEAIANLDYPNSGGTTAGVNYLRLVNESEKQTDIAPYLFYPVKVGGSGAASRDIAFDKVDTVISVPTCYVPSNVYREYDNTNSIWKYKLNLSFQDEIAVWDSIDVIDKSLWNMFYSTFVSQSFDQKSRMFTIKAKLSEGFLHNLGLEDLLQYNDQKFRINKINSNFRTGITTLELISVTNDNIIEFSRNAVTVCATTDSKIGIINEDGEPDVIFVEAGTCDTFTIIGNIRNSSGEFTAEILDSDKIWNLTTLKWDTNTNTYDA